MSTFNRRQFTDVFDVVAVVTATIDPASLADAAGATQAVTVTGAALGDFVLVAAPYDLVDVTVTGYVQAANAVEIRIQNESGAAANLASGTWRIAVLRPASSALQAAS